MEGKGQKMEKIHKVTLYVVDHGQGYTTEDILDYIDNCINLGCSSYTVLATNMESKDVEWDDDIILNDIDATDREIDEFYDGLLPVS